MAGGRSFFKIMINDFSRRLRIPPAFVRRINLEPPEGSVLTSSGKHWHVEVNKIGNDLYIGRGWQDFVRDHSLRHGDILIFRHHDDFKFDVEIFGRNGCEKADDLADAKHDKIPPCTERLEPQFGRKDLANDKTYRVTDSSISAKANGGSVIGNERQHEYKAVMLEGTCVDDEDIHVEMPYVSKRPCMTNYSSHEDCGISSAGVRYNVVQRPRKKMDALKHYVHLKSALCDGQDARESTINGTSDHILHGKQAENSDIYIVSSSVESENDQRYRKTRKRLQHSPHADLLPHGRRGAKKLAVQNKSIPVVHEMEKGKEKVCGVPYSGKMNNNCQSGINMLRRSLHLQSVQSDRREREQVDAKLVDYPVEGKESESHEADSASSSGETENVQRQRKKMKALQHLLHSDLIPYGRGGARKSAFPNKCVRMVHEKVKGNEKVYVVSSSGETNDNCQRRTNMLRRSLRLKSIQSTRRERELAPVICVDNSVSERENESHEIDSAYSDTIEPAKFSDSYCSANLFLADECQKPTTSHKNEKDSYSSKSSASLEKKVGPNLDGNATEHSPHLERQHSLGDKVSEGTDEYKSFPETEYTQTSSCEHTSAIGRFSYVRFISKRRSVTREEKASAVMEARNFKSTKPFFIVVMKPTHVYGGYHMTIPSSFVKSHISENGKDALLTTSSNQKWLVKCYVRKYNRAEFGKGWAAFVLDNNLEEGDACLFELDGSNGLAFRVHIFRVVEEVVPLCRNTK